MKRLLALFLLLVSTLGQAATGSVYIVLSDNSKLYRKAAEEIQTALLQQNFDKRIVISSAQSLDTHTIQATDLIVALGQRAVAESDSSFTQNDRIYSFVDKTQIPVSTGSQWAAIVIDQPLQRLLDVAATIVSGRYRDKIIVAVSANNDILRQEIADISNDSNMALEVIVIDDDTEPAKIIDTVLFNAGALIAVRDDKVWAGENAKWMLYQSYKFNVPVVGYSKRFLKAGALASVYATLSQTAQKTSQMIIDWNKEQGKLSEVGIVYPEFQIEFNKNIARALKIKIPEILPESEKTDVSN